MAFFLLLIRCDPFIYKAYTTEKKIVLKLSVFAIWIVSFFFVVVFYEMRHCCEYMAKTSKKELESWAKILLYENKIDSIYLFYINDVSTFTFIGIIICIKIICDINLINDPMCPQTYWKSERLFPVGKNTLHQQQKK